MKNFYLITLIIFTSLTINAQESDNFKLKEVIDFNGNQFRQAASGIVFHEGTFFITQESCDVIVIKDELKDHISIPNAPSDFEYEGITVYNNILFLIDEHSKTVQSYELDNKKNRAYKLPNICKKAEGYKGDNDSFEGIAAHPVLGIFYFLHERQKDGYAHIYTTSINAKRNKFVLAFDDINDYPIKLKNFNQRSSDLFYDPVGTRLLLILSEYYPGQRDNRKNTYLIYELPIDSLGKPQLKGLRLLKDISEDIKNLEKAPQGYDSNIEGLTLDDEGNLYLVSDNYHGDYKYCGQNIKKNDTRKTLFVKYEVKK